MNWTALAGYLMVSAAGVVAGYFIVRFAWYVSSQWKIRRAGPRRLLATRHRLWHHPEPGSSADLRFGPGGREGVPAPPYQFVEEHVAGSQPCIAVRDAQGRLWRVKWGHEVKPELAFTMRPKGGVWMRLKKRTKTATPVSTSGPAASTGS